MNLNIYSRLNNKLSRSKVDSIDPKSSVKDLRLSTSKVLGAEIGELELIYRGKSLHDDMQLSDYNIKSGVTIHVVKKHQPIPEDTPEPLDKSSMQQVVTALQTAKENPAYRSIMDKMLNDRDYLDNLISTTPGLHKDPVAIAMLQESELLGILADPSHINNVISAHPSLGQAARTVAAAVNEQVASGGSSGGRSAGRGAYSLDQMSDDDDDMASGPAQTITTSQLAQALAAATGTQSFTPSQGGSSSSQPAQSTAAQNVITQDFMRQALMQAMGGPAPQDSAAPPAVTESSLQQLRDMGITDERVARQALEAANGDIQAALEFIFGGEV